MVYFSCNPVLDLTVSRVAWPLGVASAGRPLRFFQKISRRLCNLVRLLVWEDFLFWDTWLQFPTLKLSLESLYEEPLPIPIVLTLRFL